jgi:hypothetical protein
MSCVNLTSNCYRLEENESKRSRRFQPDVFSSFPFQARHSKKSPPEFTRRDGMLGLTAMNPFTKTARMNQQAYGGFSFVSLLSGRRSYVRLALSCFVSAEAVASSSLQYQYKQME